MRTQLSCVVVGLVVFGWGVAAWGQGAERNVVAEVPAIVVAGHGQVQATPDRVSIRIGATAQAEQASDAQAQANEIVQKTVSELKRLGIAEKGIRTVEITLQPVVAERHQPPGVERKEPRVVGYRATNLIQVQSDDLHLVGKIIDTAVAAGANRVESILFELKDDLKARQEAMQMAVQEARSKAQTIASAMGVQLGSVVEVVEGSSVIERPMGAARMALAEVATPVQPGQLNVDAVVTVRYRIGEGR
ncbi:MAG: SIMPL domain-containing protein [Bacillota bacterium]